MTTKEEIIALAGECGIQNDYISEDQAVEAFYHAARKPLYDVCLNYDRKLHDAQAQLREALALESKWRVEATGLRQQLAAAKFARRQAETDKSDVERTLVAAKAEIERLKTVPMKYRRMEFNAQLQEENAELRQQLAAAQAREQQYRKLVKCSTEYKLGNPAYEQALALPADTTALEAMIAKAGEVMRERCADSIGCVSPQVLLNYVHQASNAIRTLPGVTLADLKGAE